MTREEKQLLLKDLCARLPYGVIVEITSWGGIMGASYDMRLDAGLLADLLHSEDDFKPYLRPMSSMTEEERCELRKCCRKEEGILYDIGISGAINATTIIDYLNAHHFDYRGLIPKGLAIEVTEENNPYI